MDGSRRTRTILTGTAGAFLVSLGVLAATPAATADGPVPTTITLPSVTVPTVPLPTTTTATTQTSSTTASSTTAPSRTDTTSTTTSGGSRATSRPGAIKLPGGAVSVAASTVRPPTHLLIDRLRCRPSTIRTLGQTLVVTLRVRDTQRHVVRGARILVSGGRIDALGTTVTDGTAVVRVRTGRAGLTAGSMLTLMVRAASPSVISRTRQVRVPVRPGRSHGS